MRVPVPVSTVAPRISVGVDGRIVYVEAKGAGAAADVAAGVASGVDVLDCGGVAHAPSKIHNNGTAERFRIVIRVVSCRRSGGIYQIVIRCALSLHA
jgi:hypothetical protein